MFDIGMMEMFAIISVALLALEPSDWRRASWMWGRFRRQWRQASQQILGWLGLEFGLEHEGRFDVDGPMAVAPADLVVLEASAVLPSGEKKLMRLIQGENGGWYETHGLVLPSSLSMAGTSCWLVYALDGLARRGGLDEAG